MTWFWLNRALTIIFPFSKEQWLNFSRTKQFTSVTQNNPERYCVSIIGYLLFQPSIAMHYYFVVHYDQNSLDLVTWSNAAIYWIVWTDIRKYRKCQRTSFDDSKCQHFPKVCCSWYEPYRGLIKWDFVDKLDCCCLYVLFFIIF